MMLFTVIFVVVSVVLLVSEIYVVSFEAVVAPLYQLQMEMLAYVGSEDLMAILGGWHGTKFFFLLERAAKMISLLIAIAARARPHRWTVVAA